MDAGVSKIARTKGTRGVGIDGTDKNLKLILSVAHLSVISRDRLCGCKCRARVRQVSVAGGGVGGAAVIKSRKYEIRSGKLIYESIRGVAFRYRYRSTAQPREREREVNV